MSNKQKNKQRYTLWCDSAIWNDFKQYCEANQMQKNLIIEELIKQFLLKK